MLKPSPRTSSQSPLTLLRALIIIPIIVSNLIQISFAHSTRPDPIPADSIYHLKSVSLRLLPRFVPISDRPISSSIRKRSDSSPHPSQLLHNDSLLLSFSLSKSKSESKSSASQSFHLSLRPTENLIHPSARINYYSTHPTTGQSTLRQIPLLPEHVLAYSGWVIDQGQIQSWWNEELALVDRSPHWASSESDRRVKGWARILIHETTGMEGEGDLSKLAFEGSFESDGQLWHIKPYQTYRNIKSAEDADPIHRPDHLKGGMIAWKQPSASEGDDQGAEAHLRSTASSKTQTGSLPDVSSCSYDQLPFNVDPDHPVLNPHNSFSVQPGKSFSLPSTNGISQLSNFIDSLLGLPSARQPNGFSNQGSLDLTSPATSSHLFKRQSLSNDISGFGNMSSNFVNSIGQTTGCPVGARVVFIGVAADCTYTSKHTSPDAAKTAILNNVNSASALFQRTFNVSLGVVELNVQPASCPSSAAADLPWNVGCPESGPSGLNLNDRLSVFSQWRGNKGAADGAGLWHLLTNCSSGSEIGVAWLGQLCQTSARQSSKGQVTSGTGVSAAATSEWQVMAHEIGHNFGAIHDCVAGCDLADSCCPLSSTTCSTNSNFIMAPVATRSTSAFSPCSIGNICSSLKNTINTTCLVAPGQRSVISLKQCGNGIVEPGEDCDPGQAESSCCNPQTCKFAPRAECDPTNGGCCTTQCKFASSGTVCRPSMNQECDKEERCSGSNAQCPKDEFQSNGKKCGAEGAGLTCAAGICTSRDEQCRSQGTSLRLQKSCPPSATMDCQVSCVDPTGRADCILLSNNFVDGTNCGYGGRCQAGICQSGSFKDTAQSWFESNLAIGIPIAIAAGLLGLAIIFSILRFFRDRIRACLWRSKNQSPAVRQVASSGGGFGNGGNGYVQAPPRMVTNDRHPNNGQWVHPRAWNGH